ncbi:MAG TPA: triacylglycerol lipase [Gemmatimonadaceae bacterium]|nr:triacylglycerol lipase [Gemmatimonadaceae bacterium]
MMRFKMSFGAAAIFAAVACTSDSIPGPTPTTEDNAVARLTPSGAAALLYAGKTLQISVTAQNAEGRTLSGKVFTWTSSDNTIATVSSGGLVTALKFGTATITAAVEGHTATTTISVLHDPIVFIHGFGSSGSIWSTLITRLQADGWTDSPMFAWSYDSNQSNATIAGQLATKIDSLLTASGAAKVDIIAHSMGGLSARYYAKNLGGSDKIDAFVSLASPNHGTTVANICPIISCVEMRPNSAFLNALNAVDETPGNPRYATWWTPCDQTVTPPESVILAGAVNTETACISHSDLWGDPNVYPQVRDWIK